MNTAYIHTDTGVEIKVGDTLKRTTGQEFVVSRWGFGEVRSASGYWYSLGNVMNVSQVQYPAHWIMNRATGKPVAVGDIVAGSRVLRASEYEVDIEHYGWYTAPSDTRSSKFHLELHRRSSYGEQPPEMPPHRVRAGVLQLRINDRWIANSKVGHRLVNDRTMLRWNTDTHELYAGSIVESALMAVTCTGYRIPASECVTIVRANESQLFRAIDCVTINDELYWRDDVFHLEQEDELVVELPEDYVKLFSGSYAHEDECCYCEHERGYELRGDCDEFAGDMYTNGWINDNTFVCESCGDRFHNDCYNDDGCCDNCSDNSGSSGRVKDYSCREANHYTPEKNVRIKFGIELEVEPTGDQNESLDVFDRLLPSKYAVYKEDGSLGDDGFEIVTRPDCPSVHKRVWLDTLADSRVRATTNSWKSGRCGIHIHVSRAPLSDLWVGRIVVLVNSDKMADIVAKVAGRYNKSYCEVDGRKKLTAGKGTNCSRYAAVNTCHTKTIEFRIFRGTLNRESFIKNIEFVEAVVAYCRPAVSSNANLDDPASFLQYVANNRKSYKYLYEFLVDKKFYSGVELVRPTPEFIEQRKLASLEKRKLKQPA